MPCWGGGVVEAEIPEVVGPPVVPEPVNCEVGWNTEEDVEENSGDEEDGDTTLLDALDDLTGVVIDGTEVLDWVDPVGVAVTRVLLGEAKVDELTEGLDGTGVTGVLGRTELYDPGNVEPINVLLSILEPWEGIGEQTLLVTVTVRVPKRKSKR